MKVLIIGYGSIAKKHVQVLRKIIPDVHIIALRSTPKSTVDINIKSVYSWAEVDDDIDFVIISNPTSEHYSAILEATKFNIPLFIEKPPLASLEGANKLAERIKAKNIISYTAFNLRFHPVIAWLKENLKSYRVIEVSVYCGSYLPDWRPGRDYKEIYSAKKNLGGGVHLDLLHELDYVNYLFGLPISSNSYLSKKSDLDIDSYDCAHYWLEYSRFNVTVLLNYYRRDIKRDLEIVCENETIIADLIDGKITKSTGEVLFDSNPDIIKTYEVQMTYFIKCIAKKEPTMNSYEEALQTLKLCLENEYINGDKHER
jgi:predicted dehydrogenase